MKTRFFTLSLFLLAILSFAQQNYWSKTTTSRNSEIRERRSIPDQYLLYNLDIPKMEADLAKAPQRFSKDENLVIKFPDSEGNFRNYVVQEFSIMEPQLQEKFPEIRTYVGWEKNNPENTIRITFTPYYGISVMYFDGWEVSYMDSYNKDNSIFILYKRRDIKNTTPFHCEVKEIENLVDVSTSKAPFVQDGNLRRYRLALSGTGEYTVFHGGTVALALAAMTTTMNRVNGIYEKTVSVTMQLIANNNLIIYTNSATDPFTNGNPSNMISQNQTNTDTVIGTANYDIGHVFGTNSGGLAGLGVVCNATNKASGVTGSGAPIGDPFDIDYVAHEVGHQFGANHTFNGTTSSCAGNRSSSSAYEPGSGSTIMAYAGICGGEDIQPNSDPYFHAKSIEAIYNFVTGVGNTCAVITATGNNEPTANAGSDYIIPKSTAFVLTGAGTDPDGDAVTYLWEQYDLGTATSSAPIPSTTLTGPMYRSKIPTASNKRYFPVLSSVVANNLTPAWEVTPSVARTLNFVLTVADNRVIGGQSGKDAMVVTVTNDGPFTVTSHTTNIPYTANTATTVTWNVAGTNAGTINTQNVDIVLSTDGGLTFNTVLLANTPNDGSQTVTLPNQNVAAARIMVRAVGNIYYALNSSNFSITGGLATTEIESGNFAIYPNPASNMVTIQLKNRTDKGTFVIHDAAGRLVKKGKVSGTTEILLDGFVTGNYIINIQMENGEQYSEKLIIKK